MLKILHYEANYITLQNLAEPQRYVPTEINSVFCNNTFFVLFYVILCNTTLNNIMLHYLQLLF